MGVMRRLLLVGRATLSLPFAVHCARPGPSYAGLARRVKRVPAPAGRPRIRVLTCHTRAVQADCLAAGGGLRARSGWPRRAVPACSRRVKRCASAFAGRLGPVSGARTSQAPTSPLGAQHSLGRRLPAGPHRRHRVCCSDTLGVLQLPARPPGMVGQRAQGHVDGRLPEPTLGRGPDAQ